ncbi:MAG: hypothetical protein QM784_11670 [Polyangiaceae bacterium]
MSMHDYLRRFVCIEDVAVLRILEEENVKPLNKTLVLAALPRPPIERVGTSNFEQHDDPQ